MCLKFCVLLSFGKLQYYVLFASVGFFEVGIMFTAVFDVCVCLCVTPLPVISVFHRHMAYQAHEELIPTSLYAVTSESFVTLSGEDNLAGCDHNS